MQHQNQLIKRINGALAAKLFSVAIVEYVQAPNVSNIPFF
jgi:hypothetical protein